MEPDVMRLYSSSPPPMEDAEEEEEDDDQDDFGDFGAFSAVSASGGGFGEPDAPGHASFATSPPELLNGPPAAEEAGRREAKANGAAPAGHPPLVRRRDRSDVGRPVPGAAGDGVIANGFAASDVGPGRRSFLGDRAAGDADGGPEAEFADFAAFSDTGRRGDAAGRTASEREAPPLPATCHPDADFVPDRANGAMETDAETETRLGRPLSNEAPEDTSATGSAPSPPPLREENSTPADHGQPDEDEEFGDFGDSDGPRPDADGEGGASFADAGWSAFGEESEGESWAAFRSEAAAPAEAPLSRVEKLLEASFPRADGPLTAAEGRVASLQTLVEACQDDAGGVLSGGGAWRRLRDVHEAVGLGHQWGGSYCNKTLLGCLGIDTRNILFTGQKKQPLIVPVYAASLGMLEPTKEPAKPVSAAEMIASIAQAPAAPDGASCPSDVVVQEPLPPVRFDWSSSGLTNPLDGVDPELVELTTAKMEPGGGGGAGGRVVDAFARLMSTMDKTSTSTRRMRKEERLSSEAAEVICGLPDLSFMTAKVLMFPATLVPLASQATPD
ncbi:aftiphilin-like isoform X2 [Hippocampus zosterae]|uniref:aftiphilin-like isoform X2 n=1 Tax=Hippocampus zosterae TaxID=109293 RepID=UPI00223CFF01|nr:aftiphilin-like isoform X2 [Hippocampus zosterae]